MKSHATYSPHFQYICYAIPIVKALKPILASFFALLVLAVSTSFSVGIHLCGDEVNAVALLSKAEGCAHARDLPVCHRPAPEEDCCTDQLVTYEGSQFKADAIYLGHFSFGFAEPVTHALAGEGTVASGKSQLTSYRSPPVVLSERNVLFRVFLI